MDITAKNIVTQVKLEQNMYITAKSIVTKLKLYHSPKKFILFSIFVKSGHNLQCILPSAAGVFCSKDMWCDIMIYGTIIC